MNKMYFYYAGFPISFADYKEDINPIIENKIKSLDKGVYNLLNQDEKLPLLAKVLLEHYKFEDIRAIHFPTFFDKLIKGDVALHDINIPQILVIYSIGKETAVNKEYAKNLLEFFIDKALLNNNILILSGVFTSDLRNVYKLQEKVDTLKF